MSDVDQLRETVKVLAAAVYDMAKDQYRRGSTYTSLQSYIPSNVLTNMGARDAVNAAIIDDWILKWPQEVPA